MTDGALLGWKHVPGVQPTMTIDEQVECEQAVLASPEFRAALKKHTGVDDTSLVMVDIWSAGNYGVGGRPHPPARPAALLPPHRPDRQRLRPPDRGHPPGRRPEHDEGDPRRGVRPLAAAARASATTPPTGFPTSARTSSRWRSPSRTGRASRSTGYQVTWQKWSFVIGFNAREGLTLHHLRYDDGGRERSVLYRASLTEMVVPYGDPAPTQRRKNAFDVGEYGMGMCANSLELGCDCLGLIRYFDAHLCDSRGEPLTIKNAVCMHEEDYGILWKHTDRRLPDSPQVRRSRRLVVSSISTVENYEYGFFWYLYQDGNIQFEVKLTGILSLGALPAGREAAVRRPRSRRSSTRPIISTSSTCGSTSTSTAPPTPSTRIDVVPDALGDGQPVRERLPGRGDAAQDRESRPAGNLNLETVRTWKIVNPAVKNAVGEPVGYKFLPGDNSFPFASPNAWWRKRAGFVNHHVWVTPYSRDEKYGAGDYPNQSRGGDGLIELDRAGPPDREHRRRPLVHLRPHPHPAAGGLPGDADGLHRLHAQAERLLRLQPGQRRAAVGEEDELLPLSDFP